MRFLIPLVLSIAVIALAFNMAKPLPGTDFDESFLPKASTVKYVAAGHDATVAGLFWIKGLTELGESYLSGKEYAYLGHVANLCTELDSLFYTPYYFVSGVTPIDASDTSDFVVLRRAIKQYPEQWRIAIAFALRLAKGPYPDKKAAAAVMRPYFDYPDSTIPEHIRLMYRSFELDMEQTETAIEMIVNDVMQPRFKPFCNSFQNKAFRALGYRGLGSTTGADSTVYKDVGITIKALADGKISPDLAYHRLISMKKVEPVKTEEPAAEVSMDNAAADSARVTSAPAAN